MSVITPAPPVSPPSRMANFEPFSSATGMISSTARFTRSPGITISTPSGSIILPVTSVLPRLPLVQGLVEHLHPGHHRALALLPQPHDLHRFPGLHHPPVDPPRHHRPASLDREHVLHRHHERLLALPPRRRDGLRHHPQPL